MKRPAQMTPAAEKLRLVLKEIYSNITYREPTEAELLFDNREKIVKVITKYHTANSLAKELNVSVMSITRAVHRGVIAPARATSGAMLFDQAQLETLRLHLTKSKS
jgi:hypothetical protein